jgi:predicted dehydrogenase
VAHIGCGRIAQSHDMPGVARSGLADVLAVCDLDSKRMGDGRAVVEKLYRELETPLPPVSQHSDFHEILARNDIDAVVVSTPDHWHAQIALAAVLASKDVYLQKPFTLTHEEGVLLKDAAVKSGRILQVGSQQRSWEQFRRACEVIRSGRIGNIGRVEIGLPVDPTKPDDPEQPVPKNLDYDRWLGPTPRAYYAEQRVHPQKDYGRPGWYSRPKTCGCWSRDAGPLR